MYFVPLSIAEYISGFFEEVMKIHNQVFSLLVFGRKYNLLISNGQIYHLIYKDY